MLNTKEFVLNYIKERQKEYEYGSSTYNALRNLEAVFNGNLKSEREIIIDFVNHYNDVLTSFPSHKQISADDVDIYLKYTES